MSRRSARATAACVGLSIAVAGCGSRGGAARTRGAAEQSGIPASLLAGARQLDPNPRFHPGVRGPVIGPCRARLGPRSEAHVELFAANRVVLVAAGIGTRPPRRQDGDRLVARCYGALVTLDPTGVIFTRPGSRLTLADLFRSWGQPLSNTRIASFVREGRVRAYVDGKPTSTPVTQIALRQHAEIVLEVGPYVPPHRAYTFPPA